jgi:hypothetical protein
MTPTRPSHSKDVLMRTRFACALPCLLALTGCGIAYNPSHSDGASASTGASAGGAGGGGSTPPPSLAITSLTIAGTTNTSATVTINSLSDQNASPTAWSRASTPSAVALADGYEQTVVATNADGSTSVLVTVVAGD